MARECVSPIRPFRFHGQFNNRGAGKICLSLKPATRRTRMAGRLREREENMSKANVTLVQGLYAAFQRGDIAPIIAALTPDVAWHSHGRPEDYPTLGLRRGPQD